MGTNILVVILLLLTFLPLVLIYLCVGDISVENPMGYIKHSYLMLPLFLSHCSALVSGFLFSFSAMKPPEKQGQNAFKPVDVSGFGLVLSLLLLPLISVSLLVLSLGNRAWLYAMDLIYGLSLGFMDFRKLPSLFLLMILLSFLMPVCISAVLLVNVQSVVLTAFLFTITILTIFFNIGWQFATKQGYTPTVLARVFKYSLMSVFIVLSFL